ncbi:MAG: hypothetical protein MMC33_009741 [Icmadophila ericetorum]|nr:hypothetical protein [Icmadophila ericetorum]
MKYTLALLAFAASTMATPQAVTSDLFPTPSAAPPGCVDSLASVFEISVVNATGLAKRQILRRQGVTCGGTGTLLIKLTNGKLFDSHGRQGYIASNYQYQFDGPPQAGALITDGFSICPNSTLALGGSTIFFQCLSGTFFNLYSQSQGGQCSPAFIDTIPCSGGAASAFATLSLPTGAAPTAAPSTASTGSVSTITSTVSSGGGSGSGISAPLVSQSFPSNATITGSSTTETLSLTGPVVTGTGSATGSGSASASATATVGTPSGSAGGTSATSPSASAKTTSSGGSPAINGGKEFMAFAAGVAALVMI